MRTAALRRLLHQVILLGAPLALTGCLASSSCPDDGHEPPRAESKPVDPNLADGGELDVAQCMAVCDSQTELITCVREQPESVLCIQQPYPCEGRRPVGLRSASRTTRSAFARHLADAAWLEAASVDAFRVLRRELRAHGAPRRLLRAASRGARDERRHARSTRAVAERFGVAVAPVERDASSPRSLVELALENAIEGCIRETWGALVALRQAMRATEPAVRDAMSRIARDEARHAQLAWAIDDWLRPRLSMEQREMVAAARTRALTELARELRWELPRSDRDRLGLPSAAEASELLAGVFGRLMSGDRRTPTHALRLAET